MNFFINDPKFEISIFQEDSNIVFRGARDESAGLVIGGCVNIEIKKHLAVKSLEVLLINKSSHEWTSDHDSKVIRGRVKSIINKNCLVNSKKMFHPGKYTFSFSLPLSGDTTESIHLCRQKNDYYLSVKIVYYSEYGSVNTKTYKKDVDISRDVLGDAFMYATHVDVWKAWEGMLDFRVAMPSNTFVRGGVVEVMMLFRPQVEGIRITSIGVLLWESIKYFDDSGKASKRYTRVIATTERKFEPLIDYDTSNHLETIKRQSATSKKWAGSVQNKNTLKKQGSDAPASISSAVSKLKNYLMFQSVNLGRTPKNGAQELELNSSSSDRIALQLPPSKYHLMHDCVSSVADISHRLKLYITCKTKDGNKNHVWLSIPVFISPETFEKSHNFSELPQYEESNISFQPCNLPFYTTPTCTIASEL